MYRLSSRLHYQQKTLACMTAQISHALLVDPKAICPKSIDDVHLQTPDYAYGSGVGWKLSFRRATLAG